MVRVILHLFLIILLSSFLSLSKGEWVRIATGTGIVTAIQTGSSSFILKEIPYDQNVNTFGDMAFWEARKDPNFVNGFFIHSKAYPEKVWDTKANQAKTGTQIIIYQKKTTLEETRNQRWVWVKNNAFLGVILNTDLIANVSSVGAVLMRRSDVGNPYRPYSFLTEESKSTITVWNNISDVLFVTAYTRVGILKLGNITINGTAIYSLFPESTLEFRNSYGSTIRPSSYKVKPNTDAFLRVPGVAPFPVGLRNWNGVVYYSVTQPSSINITIETNGSFYGTGLDRRNYYGPVYQITDGFINYMGDFTFYKQLPYGNQAKCTGQIEPPTSAVLRGSCDRDWLMNGVFGFEYKLV